MKSKRKHKRYQPAERTKILAAASEEKLTASQVQKRYGVVPVTFYSWRNQANGKVAAKSRKQVNSNVFEATVRKQVRAKIEQIEKDTLRDYLSSK